MEQVSKTCYEAVQHFEGLIPPGADGLYHAYHGKADKPGIWTIGWGTTWYPNGKAVREGDKGDANDIAQWLDWHIDRTADAIDAHLSFLGQMYSKFTQSMLDALVSMGYNEGTGIVGSTLFKKMLVNPLDSTIFTYKMSGLVPVVGSCEFLKWVYADGVVVDDLIFRRASEADLYSKGVLKFFPGH